MMKIGCCGSMIDKANDKIGINIVEKLAEYGYDYIELSVRDIAPLSEADYRSLRDRVAAAGIPCESCNNFLSGAQRVVGEGIDIPAVLGFAEGEFERVAPMGAKVVVFGSAPAKNVPEGFPMERAMEQLSDFLVRLDPLARAYGITIAMEPINRGESNILITAEETWRYVEKLALDNIKLLADYFHMSKEHEDMSLPLRFGKTLRHIHFARPVPRVFPKSMDEDANYAIFFDSLAKAGYEGRLSLEAYTDDFDADAPEALAFLRRAADACRTHTSD